MDVKYLKRGTVAFVLMGLAFQVLFYQQARQHHIDAIRERLLANAAAASFAVDGDALERVRSEVDRDGEDHRRIQAQLVRLANIHSDIRFVYTMRQDEKGNVYFRVDAQPEQDLNGDGHISTYEKPANIGQPYSEATPDLRRGFLVPSVDSTITRDRWGEFLTGYAPVRNSANEVVGLLGLDMDLQTLNLKLQRLKLSFIVAVSAYLLMSVFVFIWLRGRMMYSPRGV